MFPDIETRNFVQLLSKACTGTIKQLLWCPTMDLLMLCTEDDQLALHRLNWQRLWVIHPEAGVRSATWSSDGKMLAIGGTDGRITLVDSEQGDTVRLQAGLPDVAQPITALHWQDVPTADDDLTQRPCTMAARLQALCSPPPPPTPPPGYQRPSPYAPPTIKADAPSRVWTQSKVRSVLAILTTTPSSTPSLRLLTTDGFPLASVPLGGVCLLGPQTVQVCTGHALGDVWLWSSSNEGAFLSRCSSAVLNGSVEAPHVMLTAHARVQALVTGMEASMQAILKEWQPCRTAFEGLCAGFATSFAQDGNPSHTLIKELRRMLLTGMTSNAAHTHLLQHVGEGGIKRLAKQIDTAADTVHEVLSERVAPALQATLTLLGELEALGQCEPWATQLGLEVGAVRRCLAAALHMHTVLPRVVRHCSEQQAAARLFFSWMLRMVQHLSGDDVAPHGPGYAGKTVALHAFAATWLVRDPIMEVLQGARAGTPEAKEEAPHKTRGVEEGSLHMDPVEEGPLHMDPVEEGPLHMDPDAAAALAIALPDVVLADDAPGLLTHVARLADTSAALARSVHDALSPTMTVTRHLELPGSLHVSHAALATHPGTDGGAGGLSLVLAASSGGRALLVVIQSGEAVDHLKASALVLPAGCTAYQPSVYRYKGKGPESVMCLVEAAGTPEDAGSLYLVQLPTEGLSWVPLPRGSCGPVDIVQVLEDGGAVREVAAMEGVRSRCVCREEAWGSCVLDVSGQRGLAAVLLRGEVVTLFDVQDEDDEEDMEDD